jgi:hypothetical protein
MANNLFISYDLNSPHQDYNSVIEEIKSLGDWASIQKSVWYVNSTLTAEQAAGKVRSKMDSNDSLLVVDSVNNDAYWFNISEEITKHIQKYWKM